MTARRIISGLLWKYLNGSFLIMRIRYEDTLPASTQILLTRPFDGYLSPYPSARPDELSHSSATSHLKKKPFDGAVYVFRAKRADRLKMIWWDANRGHNRQRHRIEVRGSLVAVRFTDRRENNVDRYANRCRLTITPMPEHRKIKNCRCS